MDQWWSEWEGTAAAYGGQARLGRQYENRIDKSAVLESRERGREKKRQRKEREKLAEKRHDYRVEREERKS